jgi:hypothetical protein
MGILEKSDLERLQIKRIIFHVVGPEDDDLILMDEVDLGHVLEFFLERIRETNVGNRFKLIGPQQGVWPSLAAMEATPEHFIKISKQLAESFNNAHKAVASKRGAFIVAQLSGLSRPMFGLIKFDDLRVLRFAQQTTPNGRVKATVSEINNTFQEDKKAMQKSALVVLDGEEGTAAVFDRANRADATAYFRTFLGVHRLYQPEEATKRFAKAIREAFEVHRGRATPELRENWRKRLADELAARETIEPEEDFDRFGSAVFGAFFDDVQFREAVERSLQKHKVSGETINVAPAAIPIPTIRRIRTAERIEIRIPTDIDAQNVLEVIDRPGGHKEIRIKTSGISENELDTNGPAAH